jgi:protein prenyltransferase alpha subunit repeat containing protein 1
MSRSLDKNLLSRLQAEDPKPVYDDLSRIFTDSPESGLLEIEFLGQSHPLDPGVNFLRDGNAVAIPKLRLIQAFSVARQVLQQHLEHASAVIPSNVMPATAILLLMDPEHLTAANTRKRALLSSGNPTECALRSEKMFVDTLLTARLHRHTKSPTLWSHRRWLVTLCWKLGIPCDIRHDIKNVIMVAGERHPRNYVAWQHARLLLGDNLSLVATIAFDVKEFCLRNHTDISGWAFLSHCIARIPEEKTQAETCSTIVKDVLSMVDSFRWANESVWMFLRTVVARERGDEQNWTQFLATNEKLSLAAPQHSSQIVILERARYWCSERRNQRDHESGSRHAPHFTP